MNKQELLNFISKVIDAGGRVEITQYGWNVSKSDAEKLAAEFQAITGDQVVEEKGSDETKYFQVGEVLGSARGVFFYDPYMIEDVDLSGSDYDDHREAV